MSRDYTKPDFIAAFAEKHGCTLGEAKTIYEDFIDTLEDALKTEKPVKFGNLLRLSLIRTPAGIRRNPHTNTNFMGEPSWRLKAQFTKSFKTQLKGK